MANLSKNALSAVFKSNLDGNNDVNNGTETVEEASIYNKDISKSWKSQEEFERELCDAQKCVNDFLTVKIKEHFGEK